MKTARALLAAGGGANKAWADEGRPGRTWRSSFKPPKTADHRRRLSEAKGLREEVAVKRRRCAGPTNVGADGNLLETSQERETAEGTKLPAKFWLARNRRKESRDPRLTLNNLLPS
jgi:hypothetical protein